MEYRRATMRIQLYISEKKDNDILQYLEKLKSEDEDISKYIRKLIRQDMSNSYPLTEEEIIELIKKYCKNSNNVNSKTTVKNLFG